MVPRFYSTHLQEDLLEQMEYMIKSDPRLYGKDIKHLEVLVRILAVAEKFLLPDRGKLVDKTGDIFEQEVMELVRLPFMQMALEFSMGPITVEELAEAEARHKTGQLALNQEMSSRRVIVCIQTSRREEPGMFLYSGAYIDSKGKWTVSPTGMFFPYGSIPEKIDPDKLDNTMTTEENIEELKKLGSPVISFKWEQVEILPAVLRMMATKANLPIERLKDKLRWEATSDMQTVFELLNVLTCSNVDQVVFPAPTKLNKGRQRRGKLPLHSYRILTIRPGKTVKKNLKGELEEERTSPRQHVRRGHIRRFLSDHYKNKQGQRVWIQQQLVGDASKGKVEKDYKVIQAQ